MKESFTYNRAFSHAPPLVGYYPNMGVFSTDVSDFNRLSLVHLNGIAGIFYNEKSGFNQSLYLNRHHGKEEFINTFMLDAKHKYHLLTFAWEKSTPQYLLMSKKIEFAKTLAEETTIMVVIGYSFPFFNREIDKVLFQTLKASNKLKKIYFQDPYLDGSFLRSQFDLNKDIVIEHIDRLDSFFIPFEL